jgi:hypothetical protein
MARGPFQGTFQPNARSTVAMSPDAIVYFNGEPEAIGCPQCSRTFDLNRYVTSIQMDLSVDSSPGSASVSLAIPRHTIDDFYFDGNPVITPMMEVEIYAKGYYLVEGLPQYYPIFWGIVTEVSDNYSSGEHTVSINCSDILKWWELCKMNINPAYLAPAGQQGISLFGNVFEQANPYDIIYTLASQSFGDVIVGTNSMSALIREQAQPQTFSAALSDMMLYWEKRFSRMRSNLVLYGANGVAVRGETIYQAYSREATPTSNKALASTIVRNANGGPDGGQMVFDPASDKVTPFKRVYANVGVGLWQSEYQTKLELANAAKEAIGFEFYMDVTGDIIFKPPFYNLDVLGNKPTSWIQDIDIIDCNFSESESEVVTQIIMQGGFSETEDIGASASISPFVTVTDYHLLRKYGWRSQNYNSEFLSDSTQMFFHGLDILDRINSRRHRATVTIPMRPELRLGFPIYIAYKDQIWYISGISHSVQFGGRATTTLQLTSKRSKFIAPRGTGEIKLSGFDGKPEPDKDNLPRSFRYSSRQLSNNGVFTLNVGNALTMPADQSVFETQSGATNPAEPLILRHPKTGRIVGYPNVVLAYTRPFSPTDITNYAGEKSNSLANPQISKQLQAVVQKRREAYQFDQQDRFTANRNAVLQGKYLSNTYQYGLNSAGAFVYAHDSSAGGGVISETLTLPIANLQVVGGSAFDTSNNLANPMALIRPVSDERGFEVVGHFQYGRRVALRDGRLIITNPDQIAKVDLQLALSGDLSSMLAAQSQGLTNVATGYADPASTLATMTPDESQTAAVMAGADGSPDTKAPEFVEVGDLFLGDAPLGSPQVQPSVEATQLSRALTLAEMSVKDMQTRQDEDCVCLTGRADLAFMSSDYQVKVLTGDSAQDNSNLEIQSSADLDVRGGPIQSGATQLATRDVNRLEAEITVVQARVTELTSQAIESGGDPVIVQLLTEAESTLDQLQAKLVTSQGALDDQRSQYSSSSSIFTKTNSEVVSRVEQFLVNLYSTLDDAHQQFESAIRGDLMPKQNADLSNLNAAATNPPSEFAPPFSAPNRFMLGDPNASVGSVQTNASNVAKAWSNFGQSLKTSSESRAISTQISQDKASVSRLTATRDQLIKQRDSSTVVIGTDIQAQIDSISSQISNLQKQLASNQAKLNTIT